MENTALRDGACTIRVTLASARLLVCQGGIAVFGTVWMRSIRTFVFRCMCGPVFSDLDAAGVFVILLLVSRTGPCYGRLGAIWLPWVSS